MSPVPRPTTAVIPAAGLGTRFLPVTKAQPKEMVPLVDRPAIQWVVEEAVRCGLTDILVVTSRGKQAIEDHFDRSRDLEHELEAKGKTELLEQVRSIAELADVHYVRQGEPKGLGHAVSVARRHVGDRAFAVLLPDDIMRRDATVLPDMLDAYEEHGASVVALKRVGADAISAYGCAAVEEVEGSLVRITDIVEKPAPDEAPSDLAVMGRYVFGPDVFDALAEVKPGKGGEIQLTDAIQLLARDRSAHGWVFHGGRYDIGNQLDWLRATVELALDDRELGPPLRAFLAGLELDQT